MALISQLSVNLNANTKGLERGFKKAKRKVKDFTNSIFNIKTAVAGALGIGGLGAIVGDLVSVNSEMQRLKAGLKTVTGSSDNAAKAFDKIKEFSVTTPFELNEVTDAFVKMKNFGLDPSARALTAYGDLASSMGKSLNQVIEAAADAAVGETERLKEFGIRSQAIKDSTDRMFSFRGNETRVALKDVEGYLIRISESNFAGAMADQMQNLTPAFSNFRTAVQDLQVSIGEAGLNQVISTLVNNTTAWINSLDRKQIEDFTKSTLNSFAGVLDKAQSIFNYISGNEFLQYGGIIGFMLFGRLGVGVIALIDQVNSAMARDVAGIWENLTPSGVTGGAGTVDPGTYQLGDFNESQKTRFEQMRDLQQKAGEDQVKEQEKTNGFLSDIAETIRNQTNVAVAG